MARCILVKNRPLFLNNFIPCLWVGLGVFFMPFYILRNFNT